MDSEALRVRCCLRTDAGLGMITKDDPLDLKMTSGPPPYMEKKSFHMSCDTRMKSADGLKTATRSLNRVVMMDLFSMAPGGSRCLPNTNCSHCLNHVELKSNFNINEMIVNSSTKTDLKQYMTFGSDS